jgi:hypothetical protein
VAAGMNATLAELANSFDEERVRVGLRVGGGRGDNADDDALRLELTRMCAGGMFAFRGSPGSARMAVTITAWLLFTFTKFTGSLYDWRCAANLDA